MGLKILRNWKLRLLTCILMGGILAETGYLMTRIQLNGFILGLFITT